MRCEDCKQYIMRPSAEYMTSFLPIRARAIKNLESHIIILFASKGARKTSHYFAHY